MLNRLYEETLERRRFIIDLKVESELVVIQAEKGRQALIEHEMLLKDFCKTTSDIISRKILLSEP